MFRISLKDKTVIPAPIAYMKVAAVKKLVVGFRLEYRIDKRLRVLLKINLDPRLAYLLGINYLRE